MKILAIETSCDDTCAAVLDNDRILSNVISSQVDLYQKWGGVVPDIAKRAHMERIEPVINEALKRAKIKIEDIEVIGVSLGPGLAIALGIGVNKAKEMAIKYNKKLVAINHIEGHIWANLLKNKAGNPKREIKFPALALTVSGGHTKLVLIKELGKYEVVGETLDDAAGEALDKAAKMMRLGYPGGPIIERLAKTGDVNFFELPRPLMNKKILDYSFSGLKTSFYYKIKDWPIDKIYKNIANLSASFQNAVFDTLLKKFNLAIDKYEPKTLLASGGVLANLELRKRLRKLAKEKNLKIFMPFKKELNTDNAAMVGIVTYQKILRKEFVKDIDKLDRDPRYVL
ncbi:MAG: tRNA (adenosine(37)-N6)-threonylcarbamoyltransferase complex transferase subunit TsaD [Candidatus Shapirobacteria bacterium]|nr:tRNA (adenosine(37)-N6)-threonylcarbamoyltransferase complex transferase subunit TsaD [Candidatus Shapirobacteria bacterium]